MLMVEAEVVVRGIEGEGKGEMRCWGGRGGGASPLRNIGLGGGGLTTAGADAEALGVQLAWDWVWVWLLVGVAVELGPAPSSPPSPAPEGVVGGPLLLAMLLANRDVNSLTLDPPPCCCLTGGVANGDVGAGRSGDGDTAPGDTGLRWNGEFLVAVGAPREPDPIGEAYDPSGDGLYGPAVGVACYHDTRDGTGLAIGLRYSCIGLIDGASRTMVLPGSHLYKVT